MCVALPEHRATEATIRQIGEVLRNHRGESEVRIHLDTHRSLQVLRLGPEYRSIRRPRLSRRSLAALLGPACPEGRGAGQSGGPAQVVRCSDYSGPWIPGRCRACRMEG